MKGFILPGADLSDLPKAVQIAQEYKEVFFSVGVHPYDAQQYDEKKLLEYIMHPKCVAVGECGLDYFRLPEDKTQKQEEIALQKEVFIAQVKLAKQYKKPLIVHIRNASNDSKAILLEHEASKVGGVLHCFNADEQLLSLANENFYFGIGGVLTFKNAKKLVQVLPKIPKEKLLVETDAPYLTPHPFRGKRNEPSYTTYVVEKMAELLNEDIQTIQTLTSNNAQTLFKEFSSLNSLK